jgi:hypothetical protein
VSSEALPAGVSYRYAVRDENGREVIECATARQATQLARIARNQPDHPVKGAHAWDRAEKRLVGKDER